MVDESLDLKAWLRRISRLSMIKIDVENENEVIRDFLKIIEFFNKLREIDTGSIEPLFTSSIENHVVREDIPEEPLKVEEALQNVKEKVDGYIKGPKTL